MSLLAVVVAAMLAAALALGTWASPAWGIRAWIVGAALIPCWFGVSVPYLNFSQPATLLALVVGLGLLLALKRSPVFLSADLWILAILASSTLATHFGTPLTYPKEILSLWILPYVIGRAAVRYRPEIGRTMAYLGAALGALAVVEILTDVHPFKGVDLGSPLGFWAGIQYRGGLARSELSFGHSIALGAFLVATIPFVIDHVAPRHRVVGLSLVFAGVVSTLSRGAILGAAFSVFICCLPGRGLRISASRKAVALGVLGVGALAALPFALHIGNAAQIDLSRSTHAREALIPLLADTRAFGLAAGAAWDPAAHQYLFAGVSSVDETFLGVAVTIGWVTSALLAIGLLWLSLQYARGRFMGPPALSLLGQIPLFLTVALITQWTAFVWFIVGWAVGEMRVKATDTEFGPTTSNPQVGAGRAHQRHASTTSATKLSARQGVG